MRSFMLLLKTKSASALARSPTSWLIRHTDTLSSKALTTSWNTCGFSVFDFQLSERLASLLDCYHRGVHRKPFTLCMHGLPQGLRSRACALPQLYVLASFGQNSYFLWVAGGNKSSVLQPSFFLLWHWLETGTTACFKASAPTRMVLSAHYYLAGSGQTWGIFRSLFFQWKWGFPVYSKFCAIDINMSSNFTFIRRKGEVWEQQASYEELKSHLPNPSLPRLSPGETYFIWRETKRQIMEHTYLLFKNLKHKYKRRKKILTIPTPDGQDYRNQDNSNLLESLKWLSRA